jgi:hypothetical protein
MAMFDVLAIVPLESPQVFVAEGRRHTRSRFSRVSHACSDVLLDMPIFNGGVRTVQDCLTTIGEDLALTIPAWPSVALSICVPHVFLLFFSASWTSYCLPLFGSFRRGLGTDIVPEALAAFEQSQNRIEDHRPQQVSVEFLQNLVNSIRRWGPALGDATRDERCLYVQTLQHRINELRDPVSTFFSHQWAYPMEYMIGSSVNGNA